ncbi:MAG: hypothetical protein GX621_02685 [Pirellulaceae bacterium]|nr:hypothetical protein [Pirellulaceae bacterium]
MTTKTRPKKTKRSAKLTLKDRLSRLTYYRACQLLGPEGPQLIRQGVSHDEIDIDSDVYFRGDLFRLNLRGAGKRGKDIVVTITLTAESPDRLRFNCSACSTLCEHVGAAVSLVLEEKTALGLAAGGRGAVGRESSRTTDRVRRGRRGGAATLDDHAARSGGTGKSLANARAIDGCGDWQR